VRLVTPAKANGLAAMTRNSPFNPMPQVQAQPKPQRSTLSITRAPGVDSYYFVWGEGRRAPRQRHDSCEAAVAEAERLAQLHPSVSFHVYMARRVATRRAATSTE
jgi:hypothetical protein